MIGKIISHYKILEKLGGGGMGVVYKAEDFKLKRFVALKLLPPDLTRDEEAKKRLVIEAQAASSLDHPNICTVHEINETDDGQLYMVMALYEGDTLQEEIGKGPLGIEEATDIVLQITQGLEKAHGNDIIHRDLKPANVIVTTDGIAKILDFGLAKLKSLPQLTKAGTTLGTASYMSPEQISGETIDHRADIWALGVIIYEMVTGQRPFIGEYDQAIFYSILNEDQKAITGLRSDVPMELERIVNKALAKNPESRYQSITDILVDLKNLKEEHATGTSQTQTISKADQSKKRYPVYIGLALVIIIAVIVFALFREESVKPIDSIAVLPFENLSKDPEQEYFVDGMTEAIIKELSKISALRVISRTSVMQYKDIKKSLPAIAQELNVRSILEGSVIQSDGHVRITAQLIGLSPERNLWANNYDRELADFLSLSTEVATSIAKEIRVTITPEERSRLKQTRPLNPRAHQLVLQARHLMRESTTRETTEKAIEYLNNALEIDPDFALAHAALAKAYLYFHNTGYASFEEMLPKVKNAANRALEIDSTLDEAYSILSFIKFKETLNWEEREKNLKKAIELYPGSAEYHEDYAYLLLDLKRYEEALTEMKIAQRLNPLSESLNRNAAINLYIARRNDEAIERFRRMLELEPDDINTKWWLGRAYASKGMYDEAIAEFLSRKVKSPETNWALAYTYALDGQKDKARDILNFLLNKSKTTYVPPEYIAEVFIALGNKDKAFEWLDKSNALYINSDPWFDPIRDDPRFKKLLRKMNFPETN